MNGNKSSIGGRLWAFLSWSMIIGGALSLALAYLLYALGCAESGKLPGRVWLFLPRPIEIALLLSPFLGLVYFQIYAGRTWGGRLALLLAAGLMFLSGLFLAWPCRVDLERGLSDFWVGWAADITIMMIVLGSAMALELIKNYEDPEFRGPRFRPLGLSPVLALSLTALGSSLVRFEPGMILGAVAIYSHLAWLMARGLARRALLKGKSDQPGHSLGGLFQETVSLGHSLIQTQGAGSQTHHRRDVVVI